MSVADIGDGLPFREAIDLARELIKDPATRLHAAVNGWQYPQTVFELKLQRAVEAWLNSGREKGDTEWTTLGWPDDPVAEPEPEVTPDERAHYQSELDRRSSIQN